MPPRSLHILLVEDHAATNETLARMLTRRGHQVICAYDGKQAIEMAQFQQFDLLISDLGLPDTTGWAVLKQLREHQPGLRAIAVSGYGYEEEQARTLEAGFSLHVIKPTDITKIEAAIAQIFPV